MDTGGQSLCINLMRLSLAGELVGFGADTFASDTPLLRQVWGSDTNHIQEACDNDDRGDSP